MTSKRQTLADRLVLVSTSRVPASLPDPPQGFISYSSREFGTTFSITRGHNEQLLTSESDSFTHERPQRPAQGRHHDSELEIEDVPGGFQRTLIS
jgi:hypothetical protein